ncbi:LAME_0F04918g1_1 [Lachancea meyersii CBS 8951]|uniref:LAME_0F04918g1_1 n=1 Tax=Lachancea meyersii CBS 8951 TaxID=1266667 RepID=A0A1G4JSB4_9SACH|nr:LAME_0F04918g1_1 [Lachancea meyersii CBS 8951]
MNEPKEYPHGRRLKAFLRDHLRRPSKRRVLTAKPRRPIKCCKASPVVFTMKYEDPEFFGSDREDLQQLEFAKNHGSFVGDFSSEKDSYHKNDTEVSLATQKGSADAPSAFIARQRPKIEGSNYSALPPQNGHFLEQAARSEHEVVNAKDSIAKPERLADEIAQANRNFDVTGHNSANFLSRKLSVMESRRAGDCNLPVMDTEGSGDSNCLERENAEAFDTTPIEPNYVMDPGSPSCPNTDSEANSKHDSLKRIFDNPVELLTELKRPCIDKEGKHSDYDGDYDERQANESFRESSSIYSDTPSFNEPVCDTPLSMSENNPHMLENPYIEHQQSPELSKKCLPNRESPKAVTTQDAREPASYKNPPPIRTPTFTPISKLNRGASDNGNGSPLEEKFHGMVEILKYVVHHQPLAKSETGNDSTVDNGGNGVIDDNNAKKDSKACNEGSERRSSSGRSSSRGGNRSSSIKKPQTFKPSKCEEFETQQLCVPTFRQSLRKIDALGLFEDVRKGTLTERDLFNLSKVKPDDTYDFRDSRFYDNQSSKSSSSESFKAHDEESLVSSVKFDKFSHLLMYDVRKTSKFERPETSQSSRSAKACTRETKLPRSLSDSTTSEARKKRMGNCKPILKRKINERAEVEFLRAEDCDTVDVTDFLTFFKGHEARRRTEENRLSKIREQQLTNYYANDHMYNSVQNGDVKSAMIDFRRSKRATEHNIGRELRDPATIIMSCPREAEWQRLHKQSKVSQRCF